MAPPEPPCGYRRCPVSGRMWATLAAAVVGYAPGVLSASAVSLSLSFSLSPVSNPALGGWGEREREREKYYVESVHVWELPSHQSGWLE